MIWSFLHGSRRNQIELIEAVPALCSTLLAHAKVDVALVPVIEYQRVPDLLIIPDICVGSNTEVRSVILVSPVDDLHEIRSIALDESSRTSATLLRIIFREFVGHEPEWLTRAPDLHLMLGETDAALIIGDPAMNTDREGLKIWDLAALWRQFTGLGFVFAIWMARRQAAALARGVDFQGAWEEGMRHLEEIVREYQPLISLPPTELRHYLEQNICFSITAEMQNGLQLYYELAKRHNLIPEVRPLKTL